jgi:hypothetical protein
MQKDRQRFESQKLMTTPSSSPKPVVLVLEIPGRKPIGAPVPLMVATHGFEPILMSSTGHAIEMIASTSDLKVLVTNDPNVKIFEAARRRQDLITVLVTDLPMKEYAELLCGKDVELLDHIVANLDTDWTATDLGITLRKVLTQDFFGVEKYLSTDCSVQSHTVTGSADRELLNKRVQEWVDSCGVGKNISRLAHGICEELLMNAIYDAPVAGGRTHYEQLERTAKRTLASDEWSTLRLGMDQRLLAISVVDPFGAFLREKWFSYLRKALKRDDTHNLIDTKKGGAGLGLFKMLYSSHGVVCNVDPGRKTEVIVLININIPVRDFIHMPRSIHYFKN